MTTLVNLPSLPWQEWSMEIVNPVDIARMEGRYTESAEFGTPYWQIVDASTPFLEDADIDAAEAFIAQTKRGGAYFAAHDIYRPRPRSYGTSPLSGTRASGGAFDGTCDLTAIDSATELALAALPAGFAINQSANVEVRKSNLTRSLHRVVAAATADQSGVVTITVEPRLDTSVFSTGDTVNFEKPSTIFMVEDIGAVAKAWSARTLSFTAVEAFPNDP